MMPLSQNEERFNKEAVFLLGYTLATPMKKNETLFIKTSTSVMAAKRSLADKRLITALVEEKNITACQNV